MREVAEFRIPEEYAQEFLPPGLGHTLGDSVRNVVVATSDPIFERIRQVSQEFRTKSRYFFFGHAYRRYYSPEEIATAQLFHIVQKRTFEPAGEECGTLYDETKGCPLCGCGAPQTSDLHLDSRRIPKVVDLSRTIAGELVVSARFAQIIQTRQLTGAIIAPILLVDKEGHPSKEHHQLKFKAPFAEIDRRTRGGEDPFDTDAYGACACGELLGLNLLSEVHLRMSEGPVQDLMATRQFFGGRQGLLRPNRLMLLSPKAYRLAVEEKITGLRAEVAHLAMSPDCVDNPSD